MVFVRPLAQGAKKSLGIADVASLYALVLFWPF